ncbi:MAG: M20/M25/M40 family metallo-hydrolase [Myxococcota bacterium]
MVHEPAPASYGWNVVESSWSGERFGLRQADGSLPPALTYQGWLHRDAAEALAVRAGTTLEQWHADAIAPGFRAKTLPLRLAAMFETSEREIEADNIVGAVPGSTNDDEAIVITAHWDHLGLSPTPIDGDVVFNGAVDNASGIAGMLGVAASLREQVAAGTGPKRRVVFLATTAEEQGLLGSRYYAEHPLVPIDKIVAVANLDSMNVHGRTKSVVVVGAGQSTLEDTLADVVAKQGRHTIPDDRPEGGGYYRSDHFSFARRGVPALYFRGSTDLVDGGSAAGAAVAKLRSERYHTVHDEYDPNWSLEGALQDVEALVDLVLRVANADQRPAWKPASEFGNAG